MKTIAIVSGGMDSVTMAYQLKHVGDDLDILSFDYGQKHDIELEYAARVSQRLGVRHDIISLDLGNLLTSALTDENEPIPEGHYAAENMAATVVPNRNSIMLAIAVGVAISRVADRVAFAAHAGDHFIYPDCRPEFVKMFSAAERIGNEGFCNPKFEIFAPYIELTKADIVTLGSEIGVPYGLTWSCYRGVIEHCGRCGTCVERKEAFRIAKVVDPTPYEDEEYEIAAYRGE